ncbi:hypothetical protein [Jiangella mangrovi]|uniref:Gluconate 2-dehydrogenase subunit 3 family protein n=1 Tax=Jiangella mangrovi TaxID=1524084 RepID=A0A7W9LMW9_9ACTN|nr:hypothetical protein [Jiangella mangrovi]MBB5789686.1 hypothetical protein [Jiangella mangrovi]
MAVPSRDLGRRAFLARMGVLGAAAAVPALAAPLAAPSAAASPNLLPPLVGLLRPVLAELARDTISGLVVMVCPGPDAYSKAQGTPRPEPGALEARGADFMLDALDHFVPFPDQLATPLAAALTTAVDDIGLPPPGLLGPLYPTVWSLDRVLQELLENDETLPLSLVVALLLNVVATQVNPLALNGPFLSPFARLTLDEKCRAFELLEGPDADLVALLDSGLPEPLRSSISGLLRFLAGALLEFSAFGSYNEWGVYDGASRRLTERPVGWELSGYQPDGVVDGWDDFLGYYEGRTEVEA